VFQSSAFFIFEFHSYPSKLSYDWEIKPRIKAVYNMLFLFSADGKTAKRLAGNFNALFREIIELGILR